MAKAADHGAHADRHRQGDHEGGHGDRGAAQVEADVARGHLSRQAAQRRRAPASAAGWRRTTARPVSRLAPDRTAEGTGEARVDAAGENGEEEEAQADDPAPPRPGRLHGAGVACPVRGPAAEGPDRIEAEQLAERPEAPEEAGRAAQPGPATGIQSDQGGGAGRRKK